MEPNEPKTTQAKIDGVVRDIEQNGQLCQQLASALPAAIAAIPDGEVFFLVNTAVRKFRTMWRHHPEAETFWACLATLFERDATRRALFAEHDVGQLEKMGEL